MQAQVNNLGTAIYAFAGIHVIEAENVDWRKIVERSE